MKVYMAAVQEGKAIGPIRLAGPGWSSAAGSLPLFFPSSIVIISANAESIP